jgi:hypothetical protein
VRRTGRPGEDEPSGGDPDRFLEDSFEVEHAVWVPETLSRALNTADALHPGF